MKKKILTTLSVVLVLGLAALGILAYLQDEDSDVNVMTLGNVSIEQIEQEWNADKTELQDFTQAKPLYPYVGTLGWSNTEYEKGAYRTFTMNNVVDKYVSVKNTGKSDAYVRTLIAFEMGEYTIDEFNEPDKLGISVNTANGSEFKFEGAWSMNDCGVIAVDGHNYNVVEFVHANAVKPGETTIPSLLQVYLSKDATNETVEKLDGNGNGTYDILVLSQAVQTEGFENAKTALDTAFGKAADNAAAWFGGEAFPTMVATQEQLDAAITAGEDVVLGVGTYSVSGDTDITIQGSGSETVVDIDGNIQNANISNATVVGTNSLNVQADDNAIFTNVVFEGKVGIVEQGVVNGNATFEGCEFNGGLHIDKSAADSEIKFIDCDFGELCIIKLGGSANYSFEGCVIETLDTANTSGWGRAWVITYSDTTFTDCQIGRTIRAGGAINIVLDGCVDANGDAVTASIVATYNNPTVTVK